MSYLIIFLVRYLIILHVDRLRLYWTQLHTALTLHPGIELLRHIYIYIYIVFVVLRVIVYVCLIQLLMARSVT